MTDSGKKGRHRLAWELTLYLGASAAVALFLCVFLYSMSMSIAENYFLYRGAEPSEAGRAMLSMWLRNLCVLASTVIFIWLFLLLFAGKVSYLLAITKGIERLRLSRLEGEPVPVEGNDELTVLAEQINELAESQRRLRLREEEIRSERERWVRSMSHDIRNPLASMLAYSEYLKGKEDRTREEVDSFLSMVQSRSEQIRSLTDRMLGKSGAEPEWIGDGRLLMEQLLMEWESSLEEKFDCRAQLKGCAAFQGKFDVCELRRIFDNLLSNVEKYADPAFPVTLSVGTEGGFLVICQENREKAAKSGRKGLGESAQKEAGAGAVMPGKSAQRAAGAVMPGKSVQKEAEAGAVMPGESAQRAAEAGSRAPGDTGGSGCGLENIRSIVSQWGGEIKVLAGEGDFSIRICLRIDGNL